MSNNESAKTIFITGTSSGFGKAMVELFAKAGWNVAATMRGSNITRDIFKGLKNVTVFELEVTDFPQVEKVAQKVIKQFGKIDVVVNNAGYCLMGPTETSTMEQIKAQYETNVFGVFAVTKAFIPHFRENKGGMFVNFASASAQFNYPYIAAYGSSKWAVRGISESLGIELAPYNIEVRTIYPGAHATKIFTKLDTGIYSGNEAFSEYKKYYSNFLGAQTAIPNVTSPISIAQAVYKTVTKRGGNLHIVSGGDAKLYAFFKRHMSQRAFQNMMVGSILKPLSKGGIWFAKRLFGTKTSKLEVGKTGA